MNKIVGFLLIIRPINCFMMGLAVLVGTYLSYQTFFPIRLTSLAFGTAFTMMGSSMVINDYWDRSIDAINEPTRPIPSGLITENEALLYAFILIAIGLSSAFLTNPACFSIALFSLSTSLIYNTKGKQTGLIGNIMVSACISIPLLYGIFIFEGIHQDSAKRGLILLFDVMIFLSNTGREITKGISDVEGDRIRNINTLAIMYGSRTAAVIATVFYFSAISLSMFPLLTSMVSWWYLPLVVASDLGFIFSSMILLNDYTGKNARKVKNLVLISMLIGLVAFVAS